MALEQAEVLPIEARLINDETLFLDFGKAAFGTLLLPALNGRRQGPIVILQNGRALTYAD